MFRNWFSKRSSPSATRLHNLQDMAHWATFRELPPLPDWRVVDGVEYPVASFQIIPAEVFVAAPFLQDLEGRTLPGWSGKLFDQRDFESNGTWLPTTSAGEKALEIYSVPRGQMPLGYSHNVLRFLNRFAEEFEKEKKTKGIRAAETSAAGRILGLQNLLKIEFLYGQRRKQADENIKRGLVDTERRQKH